MLGNPKREEHMKIHRRWPALALLVLTATAALVSASTTGAAAQAASGSLTVWVDAVRLPVTKLYAKTHPKVHLKIVTYDGDGNGATTMQTKIQLWNRSGKGWLVCLQDNLAQEVLYVNKKRMAQFGYAVPTTWQQWAALGARVAKEHP